MSIAKPQSANLVDTLSAGYRSLHRRLWVIGIPAGMSAYLWLGAPVALGSLGDRLRAAAAEAGRLMGDEAGGRLGLIQGALASDLRLALAWLNFVPLLPPPAGGGPGVRWGSLLIGEPMHLLGAVLLINLLVLLLSSLFLTLLCEAVSGERGSLRGSLARSVGVAGGILRYLAALVGVILVMALPFLAISAIVIAAMPAATLAVLLAWYIVLFWAYVYTGFAPEAILISRAGPLRAIYHSVHLVRRDLSGTLGLLLVSFVIVSGLGVIWRQLAATPPGLALAILGSAYVGSGLSAARLEFYRERLARPGAA